MFNPGSVEQRRASGLTTSVKPPKIIDLEFFWSFVTKLTDDVDVPSHGITCFPALKTDTT